MNTYVPFERNAAGILGIQRTDEALLIVHASSEPPICGAINRGADGFSSMKAYDLETVTYDGGKMACQISPARPVGADLSDGNVKDILYSLRREGLVSGSELASAIDGFNIRSAAAETPIVSVGHTSAPSVASAKGIHAADDPYTPVAYAMEMTGSTPSNRIRPDDVNHNTTDPKVLLQARSVFRRAGADDGMHAWLTPSPV